MSLFTLSLQKNHGYISSSSTNANPMGQTLKPHPPSDFLWTKSLSQVEGLSADETFILVNLAKYVRYKLEVNQQRAPSKH
jgi:hypothetical protein